jgi:hypothetical protein
VSLLTGGMSQAIKSVPFSIRVAIKGTLRASRSNPAITSTALRLPALLQRRLQFRAVLVPLASFDLDESLSKLAGANGAQDGLTLRVEAEAACTLALRYPVISNEALHLGFFMLGGMPAIGCGLRKPVGQFPSNRAQAQHDQEVR